MVIKLRLLLRRQNANVIRMSNPKKHPLDVWRSRRGMTCAALARALGTSPSAITHAFKGERNLSKRAAISAFLLTEGEVPMATLLLGSDIYGRRSVKR